MKKVFITYSRKTQPIVTQLVEDLNTLGYTVWFDQEISGGQTWWDHILSEIRSCEIFIFGLSEHALESAACNREYEYAHALGKPILPVLLEGELSPRLMPRHLSGIQAVGYKNGSKAEIMAIAVALNKLPSAQAQSTNLPSPPEIPISYLDELKDQIDTESKLSFEEQSALVLKLKSRLANADERDDVFRLLRKLRSRNEVFLRVADQIDEIISNDTSRNEMTTTPQKQSEVSKDEPALQIDYNEGFILENVREWSVRYVGHSEGIINSRDDFDVTLNHDSHRLTMKSTLAGFKLTWDGIPVSYDGKDKWGTLSSILVFKVTDGQQELWVEVEIKAFGNKFKIKVDGQLLFNNME